MMVNIPMLEWRVLRTVGRSKKPVPGIQLRLEMTRRTKDGSFLTWLVDMGLLEIAEGRKTGRGDGGPFELTYTLTDLGHQAAEYGQIAISWEEFKALDLRVTKAVAAK